MTFKPANQQGSLDMGKRGEEGNEDDFQVPGFGDYVEGDAAVHSNEDGS